MNRRDFIHKASLGAGALGTLANMAFTPHSGQAPMKIGIIGLDTSHSTAFAKYFNSTDTSGRFRVVAAYPMGSADIESSVKSRARVTEEIKAYNVEVVDSIKTLLKKCDAILLNTNDGRPHKEQAFEVFKTGMPVFIDKPVAHNFDDVKAIYEKAAQLSVPMFSSSALRYTKNCQQIRYARMIGDVLGADAYSPATMEPNHSDLYWYGIHGVETLYTVMGPGCESVTRFYQEGTDVVVGLWKDGRIGTFRGTRNGKHNYGGTAFGSDGNAALGPFEGYDALSEKIAEFFITKKAPIDPEETIEIYAFMSAAEESRKKGGVSVKLNV